jgi:hypothetical protein
MWSCPPTKRVIHQHTPNQELGCPRTFLGLIHQGTRPRINPCPRHGYPGTFPGALDISRDFNCLVPDQKPQSYTGGPLRGLLLLGPRPRTPVIYWGPLQGSFAAWSQTKNPSHLLGALTRVLCHGTDCLVPDQEPQGCTGGPRSRLGSLPSSRRMALAAALNSTIFYAAICNMLGLVDPLGSHH